MQATPTPPIGGQEEGAQIRRLSETTRLFLKSLKRCIMQNKTERVHIATANEYEEMLLQREIDAQNYLLNSAEKYKIPVEESEVTRTNFAEYEAQLEKLTKGGG